MIEIIKSIADILSAFSTPMIAGIVAYIAWRQHKTDRDKLRLSLYDRRYKIFEAGMRFISYVLINGLSSNKESDDELVKLSRATKESTFLFNDEISKYIKTLYDRGIDLQTIEKELENQSLPVGTKRTELANKSLDIRQWFGKQFDELKKKVEPYMSFINSL